jgi:4-hydroxybenzoyl-CoA reductase subunit beta
MMRLPPFEFAAPSTVSEAVAAMAAAGKDGMYVAGGTDLYPNMKRRQMTPRVVVSLMEIPELHQISGTPASGMKIGACVTLTELCRHAALLQHYPALTYAASVISTPLLRNMGTIGGNVLLDTRCNYYDQNYEWRRGINFCMKKDGEICWVAPSSPRCWAVQSSDTVPVLVAMNAQLRLVGPKGERVVAAGAMFNDDGIHYLHKAPDELLTNIELPAADGSWRAGYRKLRRRGSFDFPVLGVAAWVKGELGGAVDDVRLVLGALGSAPLRATKAEDLLRGRPLDDDSIRAAAEAAYGPARPLDNTDFHYTWRKQMVKKFVADTLRAL